MAAPLPLPLLVAIALALPLVLGIAVKGIWGGRDLYDVMSSRISGAESLVLGALPVLAPALVFLVVATVVLPSSAALPVCGACRRAQRLAMVRWRALLWLSFVLLAALWTVWTGGPRLQSVVSGALFLPLALAWAALERRSSKGPLRATVRGDVVRWSGDLERARQLAKLAPSSEDGSRPSPRELLAWALPIIVGIALIGIEPLEPLAEPCTWGTYPLRYRSGAARVWGCKLPNGRRHGAWHGEGGAWSSSSSIGYDASYWFGEFDGAAELRTEGAGGLIARGPFRRGRAVGIWRVLDEHGDVKEVTDMDTRVVTRAWDMSCPPGAVATIEGDPHYADRVCIAARERRVGSYYSIRDLRLVERGSFVDGVRTPDAR